MKARSIIAAVVLGALSLSGCAVASAADTTSDMATGCGVVSTSGSAKDLTPAQNANAKAIIGVAQSLGFGRQGAVIGIAVALSEATLYNYASQRVPGSIDVKPNDGYPPSGGDLDSVGLFQQRTPWGPLAERMNPTKSATLFYTGGRGGQKGLAQIPDWKTRPAHEVAQAVELSGTPDGSKYLKQMPLAIAVTDAVIGSPTDAVAASSAPIMPETAACPNSAITNGSTVTLPDNPNVAAAVRNKIITTPSAGMAKGIAAGLAYLGAPYVWGGGGDGEGPNNGCSRGGGSLNSCGSDIGFDCSGLTAYVYVQGGYPSPGGNSGVQRAGGVSIPYDQGLPGDIVGFPGHVAIYLGVIDGTPYILEASEVGVPIHVVPLTRKDKDSSLHRYWAAA